MELSQAIVIFLLYVNFIADPVIYLTRTQEVKKAYNGAFRALLRRCQLLTDNGSVVIPSTPVEKTSLTSLPDKQGQHKNTGKPLAEGQAMLCVGQVDIHSNTALRLETQTFNNNVYEDDGLKDINDAKFDENNFQNAITIHDQNSECNGIIIEQKYD